MKGPMRCHVCGEEAPAVKTMPNKNAVYRQRRCKNGHSFPTREYSVEHLRAAAMMFLRETADAVERRLEGSRKGGFQKAANRRLTA